MKHIRIFGIVWLVVLLTKQGCADVLNIDASLAGRTLTVKKEIQMISPPPTQDDPDPKKRFRLK